MLLYRSKIVKRYLKIPYAGFTAGKVAKPLPFGTVWYNKDIKICGCSLPMAKSQNPRAKNKI